MTALDLDAISAFMESTRMDFAIRRRVNILIAEVKRLNRENAELHLGLCAGADEDSQALKDLAQQLAESQAEVERLRQRTHEIQAQEMARRAKLDKDMHQAKSFIERGRKWSSQLIANWTSDPGATFWSHGSYHNRAIVTALVLERDEARAEVERLRGALSSLATACDPYLTDAAPGETLSGKWSMAFERLSLAVCEARQMDGVE